MRIAALAVVLLPLAACRAAPRKTNPQASRELQRLLTWTTGRFSSEAQAKNDKSGYDTKNKPVWGPDAGPYIFRKVADTDPKAIPCA